MITEIRKSKYKTKITMPFSENGRNNDKEVEMRAWCEEQFGPGGRRNIWRFGWTQKDITFYFRSQQDALLFTLKWS